MNTLPNNADSEFSRELLKAIPSLRAFGVSLSGAVDRADDLVQETLTKAWANRQSFQPGTNFKAWVFTILRNEFYSIMRKKKREVEDADGAIAAGVGVHGGQDSHMDMNDMKAALTKLPPDQREALLLVSASDLSYEEAAAICGVAVGTIKSRVNRARTKLADILQLANSTEFGPDPRSSAAISNGPSS